MQSSSRLYSRPSRFQRDSLACAAQVAFSIRTLRRRSGVPESVHLQSSALLDTLGHQYRSGEPALHAIVVSPSKNLLRRVQPWLRGTSLHQDLNIINNANNPNLGGAIQTYHERGSAPIGLHTYHRAVAQARNAACHDHRKGCTLNPDAVEFSPLGIDSMLQHFVPQAASLADPCDLNESGMYEQDWCTLPAYNFNVHPAGGAMIPQSHLLSDPFFDADGLIALAKDLMWQFQDVKSRFDDMKSEYDAMDILGTIASFSDRLGVLEMIENAHHVREMDTLTRLMEQQQDTQMLLTCAMERQTVSTEETSLASTSMVEDTDVAATIEK